uniref:DUF3444 domain-containing protein n=1 Tax=Bursaphelenchus xylophilus TaxID=6326 RepID=A0A1I7SN61_BURXY
MASPENLIVSQKMTDGEMRERAGEGVRKAGSKEADDSEHFKPVHAEVECEGQHNVPKGVEMEFRVQIASGKFDGLSKTY